MNREEAWDILTDECRLFDVNSKYGYNRDEKALKYREALNVALHSLKRPLPAKAKQELDEACNKCENKIPDDIYEELKQRLLSDGYLIHDTRGKKKYTYFSKFQDYMRSQYTQGRNVAGYGAFMDHIKAAIKWACCAKSSEQLPDIYQEEVNKWAIEFAQKMLNIHDKEVENE